MKHTALFLITAAPLLGQANRDSYRTPYQAWRDIAPALEQDAAAPNTEFEGRVQASREAVERFLAARAAYFTGVSADSAAETEWMTKPLVHAEALITARPEVDVMLMRAGEFLNTTIQNFSNIKDPAIQQVRQAMERERAALNSLNQTLSARGAGIRELVEATDDAEVLRTTVAQGVANSSARREQVATHIRNEATAWTTYYRDLAEGAASTTPPPTAAGAKPVLVQRPSPAGATPLSRYTGSWEYPARNGIFLGAQPQTVQLDVTEDNGKMSGTLTARFVIPPGRGGDPTLRLTFEGLIVQSRVQSFPLATAEGISGTIELIPGAAINLLEVNLQTAANGNKVTNANFVLLKR